MDTNYQSVIDFISEKSGISKEEIEKKIEAKQSKLAGLISKVGAAQIVAAELNVSFDKQSIKISQIVPGIKKINITGKIITLFPIREYNKNGRAGRIGSFILADETSNVRVVLWDENHIELISKGDIATNKVIDIENATLRNGEIHLTSFSEIKISNKSLDSVIVDKPKVNKKIAHFNPNDNVLTRAFIVQFFEPRFFEICPACKKKVSETKECLTHGKVVSERRALLNFVIDDGTESIRSVVFSDQISKIMPGIDISDSQAFSLKKSDLLGKELIIHGQVRRNTVYNNNEFVVTDFEEIDLNKLIQELEN
ncbi:MAG: hypothetical protein WC867_06920 [Candidatus Pacearchaeota archaeon]|jgi:replication factor A1